MCSYSWHSEEEIEFGANYQPLKSSKGTETCLQVTVSVALLLNTSQSLLKLIKGLNC